MSVWFLWIFMEDIAAVGVWVEKISLDGHIIIVFKLFLIKNNPVLVQNGNISEPNVVS